MARTWLILFIALLFSASGNVILKSTMIDRAPDESATAIALDLIANPIFWTGLILFGVGLLLWLRVLAVEQLGRVYPLAVSFSFTFILTAAALLFGETYSANRLAGVALIVVGMGLCTWDFGQSKLEQQP